MKNNMALVIVIAIGALILAGGVGYYLFYGSKYNQIVSLDEDAKTAWSQVETQYQRRADLIPNLVNTVKGYAAHEKETLTEVIEARSKATQMNIDASKLTPETFQQFQKVQGNLSSALSRLLVSVERYPDLKANQNFRDLQAQLEGTENRIAVSRDRYNSAVSNYNKYVRGFINQIVAKKYGFEMEKQRFEAAKGTDIAPKVEF